jgi:hypothetical protein
MRIIYNGLDLMCLETHDFSVQAVYDDEGVDYLYTRAYIHATVLINGDSAVVFGSAPGPFISYAFAGTTISGAGILGGLIAIASPIDGALLSGVSLVNAGVPPAFLPLPGAAGIKVGIINSTPRAIIRIPNAPPLTHSVVRHRLQSPRGQLYVFSGPGMETGVPTVSTPNPPVGPIILSSPGLGNICDCKSGPMPKIFSINAAVGDSNTFVADWACETYINEAAINEVSPMSGLLSNRYSQRHSVDTDGWTTIMTEGTAIYRTDMTFNNLQSPDSERAQLFMPIPQGFIREINYVEGLPDVTGVRYGYTDTQQKSNFVAGPYTNPNIPGTGASSITVLHRQAVSTGEDILTGALSAYERTVGLMLNTKWLKENKESIHHATPGGPGAKRLRTPGKP